MSEQFYKTVITALLNTGTLEADFETRRMLEDRFGFTLTKNPNQRYSYRTGSIMTEPIRPKPKYTHDCEQCQFLGRGDSQYKDDEYGYVMTKDYYFCPNEETVVVRHSSEGSDYSSGIAFRHTDHNIMEAYNRAIDAGFMIKEKDDDSRRN